MSSHTALPVEPLDVLIMGAGVSGIGAAAYLRRNQPNKTFAILESRERMGGYLGPVPIPRHPLRLGPLHLRFRLQALDQGQVLGGRRGYS